MLSEEIRLNRTMTILILTEFEWRVTCGLLDRIKINHLPAVLEERKTLHRAYTCCETMLQSAGVGEVGWFWFTLVDGLIVCEPFNNTGSTLSFSSDGMSVVNNSTDELW